MKYGEQFEKESAPQWSLHNIDYNSLKRYIKVHTTKDQATAIAIPGRQDTALRAFEDELYAELCRQHDRVDLFVSSKADEIARRLQYLSNQVHQLLIRCANSRGEVMTPKRQRLFAKYENDLLQCKHDTQSLERFVGAQVVAFRKILKKYRKWTGSSTLGSRFRDAVLSHPKSFTRRDFSHLDSEQGHLMETLREAFPARYDCAGSLVARLPAAPLTSPLAGEPQSREELGDAPNSQAAGYWNEYDHGSDAGDRERNDEALYAIYVNPDEDTGFPGVAALAAISKTLVSRINEWAAGHGMSATDEEGPLLASDPIRYGTANTASLRQPPDGAVSDTEAEDEGGRSTFLGRRGSYGYASSEDFPAGYKPYYAALPSVEEQQLARRRDGALFWGTWICFSISFILMSIAALLIKTGKHKMRLEVDAGVTLGVVSSLGAACAALGMTFSRRQSPGWMMSVSVWTLFSITCLLNGMLLVLVVDKTPL